VRAGHDVKWTRGEFVSGDVALVLSSLVDYRNETAWAYQVRSRGVKVGFVGITASKVPELFRDHCVFIVDGEPEIVVIRLAQTGEIPPGRVVSGQSTISIRCRSCAGILSRRIAARHSESSGRRGPWAEGIRCLRAVAVRSPVPTAHTGFSPATGRDRLRTSSTRLNGSATRCGGRTSSSAIRSSPSIAIAASSSATRSNHGGCSSPSRLRRVWTGLARLNDAGLRAMSFGVESLDPAKIRKAGRRPIPLEHQRRVIEYCREKGIVTAAFYVFGFLQDDRSSIAATIDYATELGSTFAQFKILTPYPGTPVFKQLGPLLTETDWEKFDGYTPTFRHPNLSDQQLRYLLGAAYRRFYMRPSYLANVLKIENRLVRDRVARMDRRVNDRHAREEIADIERPVTC
jgi:hypothetical protein